MIDNIETYNCEGRDCGRKFQKFDQLLDHYKRRHNELFLKYKDSEVIKQNNTNLSEISVSNLKNKNILNNLFEKINSLEKEANSTFMFQKEDLDKDNLGLGENLQLEDLDYNQEENDDCEENFEPHQNLEKSEKIIDDLQNYDNLDNLDNLAKPKNLNDLYLDEKSANQSMMNATTSSIAIDRVTVITDELLGIGTEYADYDEIIEV
jgi:predicted ribonuclease YlaK